MKNILMRNAAVAVVAAVLAAGCGSDVDKGAAALAKNDLNGAKKYYGSALAKDPNSAAAKEGLASAYVLQAAKLYNRQQKRAVNMAEKAEELYDASMGADLKGYFCEYYLMYAAALLDEGKESKALEALEHANETFGPSDRVTAEYDKIRVDYAAHMMNMGEKKYAEYRKTRDDFKLLYAESYLTYALKYDPSLAKAAELVSDIRKKTIKMANPEDRIPFAVPLVKRSGGTLLAGVYIKSNHVAVRLDTDPANFKLTGSDGKEYAADASLVKGMKVLEAGELAAQDEAEGALGFALPKGVDPVKLAYDDGTNRVEKYFP